jgi:hypothetical protein
VNIGYPRIPVGQTIGFCRLRSLQHKHTADHTRGADDRVLSSAFFAAQAYGRPQKPMVCPTRSLQHKHTADHTRAAVLRNQLQSAI